MGIQAMDHFTVLTEDLEATRAFYRDLGLAEGPRPPLGFPGAWLYAGGRAILHVIAGRPLPAGRAGVIDHMAFRAEDLAGTVARLRARGLDYQLRRQAGGGPWQLFVFDPNGARVELDFDPAEPAPEGYEAPRG